MKIKKSLKHGFSLVETMITISVLVLVITGPLTLASQSLKAASAAKNNFIAANLAQEGIELIRLYRTNNILQGRGWMEGLLPPGPAECQSANGCYIDARNFILYKCSGPPIYSGSNCPLLKADSSNGFYNYTSGNITIFQRTIRLTKIGVTSLNDDIIRLNVTITWSSNTGMQSLSVEEIILNGLRL